MGIHHVTPTKYVTLRTNEIQHMGSTGWQRPIGRLIFRGHFPFLEVIFRKTYTHTWSFLEVIFRKMTSEDKASYSSVLQFVLQCVAVCCSVSPKSLILSGSFAKRDLQLKASSASSPPCTQNQRVGILMGVDILIYVSFYIQ